MGIGVQCEACGEVAEHAADGLDIYTILEGNGCEGVAEVVESDLGDASPFQHPLKHIIHTVRGDRAAIGRREYILVMGLGFLLFQNFYRLLRDGHSAVGVLCFQRRFHDLTVHSRNLPSDLNDAVLPVNVRPFQPQQFAPAQAGCQLDVVH